MSFSYFRPRPDQLEAGALPRPRLLVSGGHMMGISSAMETTECVNGPRQWKDTVAVRCRPNARDTRARAIETRPCISVSERVRCPQSAGGGMVDATLKGDDRLSVGNSL